MPTHIEVNTLVQSSRILRTPLHRPPSSRHISSFSGVGSQGALRTDSDDTFQILGDPGRAEGPFEMAGQPAVPGHKLGGGDGMHNVREGKIGNAPAYVPHELCAMYNI
jgi:hypothetical protein